MTALSITAANVVAAANAVIVYGKAGETLTAGQPLYRPAATRKAKKKSPRTIFSGAGAFFLISLAPTRRPAPFR